MSYLEQHGTRATPQSEPIPGSGQVENSAGGYGWAVDPWARLRRFLILGSEGGSYYASERELTFENVEVVRELARSDGERLVREIVDVSHAGRAPSNDPCLYALAVALSMGDAQTKLDAGLALPRVARIGTHLFHFARYVETQRGWGRQLRKAVAEWCLAKPVDQLAYDAIKYRQRDGWSHRDLLRLAHPKPRHGRDLPVGVPVDQAALFDWIANPDRDPIASERHVGPALRLLYAFEQAQAAETPARTVELVREYGLPREALRSDHLADRDVWRAMLSQGMPLGALVRNLGNMTRLGVLEDSYTQLVLEQLGSRDAIRRSRLHPLAVLVALATYASGHGHRGQNAWTPKASVTDALDEAFYLAFDNVEATGKRILLGLDVSASMSTGSVAGSPLTPRAASAALALVTLATEPNVDVVAFTGDLTPLGLISRQRLDDAVRTVSGLPFGRTDCALPMQYALDGGRDYDAFVILTDSETWCGGIHPSQALRNYRDASGIDARLAVVGMVSNGFSIADPADRGMLDVVGFDTATPAIVSDFVAGRV